jgi:hypothetical protein
VSTDTLEIRIGSRIYDVGYPTDATADRVFDKPDFQRACSEEDGALAGHAVNRWEQRDVAATLTVNTTAGQPWGSASFPDSGWFRMSGGATPPGADLESNWIETNPVGDGLSPSGSTTRASPSSPTAGRCRTR